MDAGVVVVGSVNVDLVVRTPRLPAPGETVIGGSFHRSPGGKGANQAVAAARLGARTWMVGLVGPDDLGAQARRDLQGAGVDVELMGEGMSPTGVAAILVDGRGENMIAVASGANAEVTAEQAREAVAGIRADRGVVLASLEIPIEAVASAADAAAGRGWPFVLNPAPARELPPGLLARCAVVVANEVEARAMGSLPEAILDAGPTALVVTRGPEGADLHRPGQPVHRQPAFSVQVVDSTGAGDAFVGALACALVEGRALEEGIRRATAAGALACREVGARAGFPDREELDRFLAEQR